MDDTTTHSRAQRGARAGRAAVMAAAVAAVLVLAGCGAVTPRQAETSVRAAFPSALKGRADRGGAGILVHSDRLGLDVQARADQGGPEAFHVASVGKAFTTVLVAQLIDDGVLHLEDHVAPLLPAGTLDGLFVVDGVDHQAEVTVGHLLGHTSGVADYFAGPARGGKTVAQLIVQEPQRRWTPAQLVEFSRTEQSAAGLPGQAFHYSDTGFILLGLLVERLRGAPFEVVLERKILGPLGMDHTWMPYRSHPRAGGDERLRPAWLSGTDVSGSPSITADWAGGGIASTERDLLRFQQALWSNRLVSAATLASLQSFDHVFQRGIHYGRGLMQLRFGEFFFLLGSYPPMVGHMGVLSSQMFYDPVHDVHVILTLGSDAAMEDSVKLIISVMGNVLRVAPAKGAAAAR